MRMFGFILLSRRMRTNTRLRNCSTVLTTKTTTAGIDGVDSADSAQRLEGDIMSRILTKAVAFVPSFGWTRDAVAAGAHAAGYSEGVVALFHDVECSLVLHFVKSLNDQFAHYLTEQAVQRTSSKMSQFDFISNALKYRLSMQIPHVDRWAQASAAIAAKPTSYTEHASELLRMSDDVWYHAGDRSTDFSWYTKRFYLIGVYQATELFMLQDRTLNFESSWQFLERQLNDWRTLGNFSTQLSALASSSWVTSFNLLGLGHLRR